MPDSELPYMKFFPADWLADCDVLSMAARGAWQTFLCKAWKARSASVTLKIAQWSRVFGATNAEQAERAIAEIEECEIGDVIREDDGRVTLVSRRIERDLEAMGVEKKQRSQAARLAAEARWEKERQRKQCEPDADTMRDACETHSERNADAMRKDAISEARSQNPEVPPKSPKGDWDGIFPKSSLSKSKSDQKRTKVLRNNEQMAFVGKWFGRRPDTLWSVAEAKALRDLDPSRDEVKLMDAYRQTANEYHRRDVITLLNNWSTELDRARVAIGPVNDHSQGSSKKQEGPDGWREMHLEIYEVDAPLRWGHLEKDRRKAITEELERR